MKTTLALLVFLAFLMVPFSAYAAAEPEKAEEDPFRLMNEERIGDLRIGLSGAEVEKSIPCKYRKGKTQFGQATGAYEQEWECAGKGLWLMMSSERRNSPKSVAAVKIVAPSVLQTARGIRVGSSEEEVLKAYGAEEEKDLGSPRAKGESFVAGSIYGGLIFEFKDGKVISIFLGAGAE